MRQIGRESDERVEEWLATPGQLAWCVVLCTSTRSKTHARTRHTRDTHIHRLQQVQAQTASLLVLLLHTQVSLLDLLWTLYGPPY